MAGAIQLHNAKTTSFSDRCQSYYIMHDKKTIPSRMQETVWYFYFEAFPTTNKNMAAVGVLFSRGVINSLLVLWLAILISLARSFNSRLLDP